MAGYRAWLRQENQLLICMSMVSEWPIDHLSGNISIFISGCVSSNGSCDVRFRTTDLCLTQIILKVATI